MKAGTRQSMKLAGGSLSLAGLIFAGSGPVLPLLLMGSGLALLVAAVAFVRVKPEGKVGVPGSTRRASGLTLIVFGLLLVILAAVYLPSNRLGGGPSFVLVALGGLGIGLVIVGAVRGVSRAIASIRH